MIEENFQNTLYTNDNLFVLNGLNSDLVDLIYLDPPFNTKRMFSAPVGSKAAGSSFKDMWSWEDVNEEYLIKLDALHPGLMDFIIGVEQIHSKAMAAYLTYMAQRIVEMHRVLKDTGSLYLHCDPTASHYLKILLDRVFGKSNFRNEITWCYTRMAAKGQRQLSRAHDIIFWYSKGKEWTFNVDDIRQPYSVASKDREGYKLTKLGSGIPKDPKTILNEKGKFPEDWYLIPYLRGKERTGYPTQKPLALLHRIVKASSNEGDVVLDPFCGCATTCVAAQQLNRKWLGIDVAEQAAHILIQRLSDDSQIFKDFVNRKDIPKRTDLVAEPPNLSVKERLYKQQNCICNGCRAYFDIRNLEIDHIIPKAKGGGDYYENYQLLCGACNRVKGDRPMEYLLNSIKRRAAELDKRIFGE